MAVDNKQLSNPYSTGGGGARFEAHIQATFVTLMLSRGYAPCLPTWPIVEIRLQGAVDGYRTDDLIVFVEDPANKDRRKLLGQVKSSIKITKGSGIFAEVVQAAWKDFNDPKVFTKGKDLIALITGPISATDTEGVTVLLEQARYTPDAGEFLTRIDRANFCSDKVRDKLAAFRNKLKMANDDKDVGDQDLHGFLKHFHLLGYDLAKKGSVVSSLLQSHIAQFNKDIPKEIWDQIVSTVQDFNQRAGTITLDTLPDYLVKYFKEPEIARTRQSFVKEDVGSEYPNEQIVTDWNQHPSAKKLALSCLVGSWDEGSEADIAVFTQMVGADYDSWIADLREVLQAHDCPLIYRNGIWRFKDRLKSWQELGSRIFDNHLDTLKSTALEVLRVADPSFDLPGEERYAASIRGKVLPHSYKLREGLAESLAIVGSRPESLPRCRDGKADAISLRTVRELFENSDWIRWGSLNRLLPILSESSPDEFLQAVENAVAANPSPFDKLFEEEDAGIFARNYVSGLLSALEGIAWEETYLTRTVVVLAEIASHDPGGNWANRPGNSLTDIFLPWKPHTLASAEKRQAALKIICAEQSDVGWRLLESLLPDKCSTTFGTHKPSWRGAIPDNGEKSATHDEYWEQSRFCAELMVEQAGFDVSRLALLAANYDHLPLLASDKFREKLLTEQCTQLTEEERIPIWTALRKLIDHHRPFPNANWSLGDDRILPIEDIARQLAPKSLGLLHRRLFSEADAYFYEGNGDRQDVRKQLFQMRKNAIEEILRESGLPQVLDFAKTVSNSDLVGEVLADFREPQFDAELLPDYLDKTDQALWALTARYAWCRRYMGGWQWFDDIDKTGWEPKQIALLLGALPFEGDAWERVKQLLDGNEDEYWNTTDANIYCTDDDMEYALGKLLEFDRPIAVVNGLNPDMLNKKEINPDLACKALLALAQIDGSSGKVDSNHITKIIKALQKNADIDQDQLLHVEWAYLTLLDRHQNNPPITLENRLASDPGFFCELIQLIYRAKDTEPEGEPSEHRRNMATNAYRLLNTWRVVPGARTDTEFNPDAFAKWLSAMEVNVKASGHYDVAMIRLGNVLVNSPKGPDGLWIHPAIAEALNDKERSSLRDGYGRGIRNSRGVHRVDPEAKPEKAPADKYRQQAEEIEDAGYYRLADTLRDVAKRYENDARRIVSNGRIPD